MYFSLDDFVNIIVVVLIIKPNKIKTLIVKSITLAKNCLVLSFILDTDMPPRLSKFGYATSLLKDLH